MSEPVELTERVAVDAPAEAVWAALTDWSRQGEWMLGTSVRVVGGDGAGVGTRLAARTGVGPLGFTDTMEITEWQPPKRCVVRHTGLLVRGVGVFEVLADGPHSVFVWSEQLQLPLGALGRAGWPLAKPPFAAGVRYSLRRFATFARRYR